ncbi:MAG: hypothetical protein WD572_04990 [Gammaproteobacteria bacterium]
MIAIWLLFTLVLFVIEPLHQRIHRHCQTLTTPQATDADISVAY